MEYNNNEPCKDLSGNVTFADMFRPVNSTQVITDDYGYEWKKETAGGWIRVEDNFFIPMGPNGQFYQHKFHSVENQKLMRAYMENKSNNGIKSK
tara:strand:+ start:350 stop:631 length:282 start_codon:yes stop_codon:yes gene_type:complete